MRLIHVILFLLVAIGVLLIGLLFSGGPDNATGQPHAVIAGMSSGGDGLARLGGMGWMMFLLQVLALLLIYALIALGVSERHRSRSFWMLLGLGAVLSIAIWCGLYLSYLHVLETGEMRMLLGYPLSTAFMLFGVFLGGSYLCVFYIWGFRRFIYTDADEAAYESLRATAAAPRKPDSATGGSAH